MRFGNFSPSSTQTTGPHDMPKATTKRLAATRATGPATRSSPGVMVPSAAVVVLAMPKMTAIVASVIVMPIEPMMSSGLRPTGRSRRWRSAS